MTKKERKLKHLQELKDFYIKLHHTDPNKIMSADELVELRRLNAESRALKLTEGEMLRAIHAWKFEQ